MTDRRNELKGPFDFEKLFAQPTTTTKAAADASVAARATHGSGAPDPVAERCRSLVAQAERDQRVHAANLMRPCKGENVISCTPLELPDIRPRVYVFWGASQCDCIESDDTEVMTVLVHNPYSNLTLCNVEIARLRLVRADGKPISLLPDGTESVQLVPSGLFCFGDLGPCRFAYRQFVLRLRGAAAGTYQIMIEGLCYELCMHRMTEACVTFDVCPD